MFVLGDGAVAVQWDEKRVQELLTGQYREFKASEFGQPVSDFQLEQLQAAGRVEHFNRAYVWLYALPETNRYDREIKTLERSPDRVRAYYLNTTLPKSQLSNVGALLQTLNLSDKFDVLSHNEMVAVMGKERAPFKHLEDAEIAQRYLRARAPEIFRDTVVAFVDVPTRNGAHKNLKLQTSEVGDLDTLIRSQTDVSITTGKRVVLVGQRPLERQPVQHLLNKMAFNVQVASSGQAALYALEEHLPDLLVTDLQLPDMHAWEMLLKSREISRDVRPLTVVIAEAGTSPDNQSFGRTVAGVDLYLVRPIVIKRLRQSIWTLVHQRELESQQNPPAT